MVHRSPCMLAHRDCCCRASRVRHKSSVSDPASPERSPSSSWISHDVVMRLQRRLQDARTVRTRCRARRANSVISDAIDRALPRSLLLVIASSSRSNRRHRLTKTVFEAVAEYLEARGALLRGGTIVDATLIAASPSTKNEAGKRDPQMHSSKKGNQWYFGMKAHVGVDASSGLVHTAGVTSGNVHDAKVMDRLVREDDTAVYGDKGYANDTKKRAAEAAGVLWAVKEKAKPGGRLTARQRARNHRFGKVRARVEHVFRVVKCQFGYRKVRYRGIAKNGAQVFSLLALANLYLARRTFASA